MISMIISPTNHSQNIICNIQYIIYIILYIINTIICYKNKQEKLESKTYTLFDIYDIQINGVNIRIKERLEMIDQIQELTTIIENMKKENIEVINRYNGEKISNDLIMKDIFNRKIGRKVHDLADFFFK